MKRFLSILLFASLLFVGNVSSFDTGHHGDLTRNAMEILGYNKNAQTVAAVSNWMVDYFSYTLGFEDIPELDSLHFDNLYYFVNISNYMNHLVQNTRTAVQKAVANNDGLTFLSILGATLHAYQDFYTHSSWPEHHQTDCGCYRTDTYFEALNKANGSIIELQRNLQSIRTYSWGDGCNQFERDCFPGTLDHGGYCSGINKDSYVRPWFERAYGHAFAGSVEWVYNLENWLEEFGGSTDFLNSIKQYNTSESNLEDLASDYESSVIVSYATETFFQDDGHYKGAGSGNRKRFYSSAVEFMASSSIYKQQFTVKKFYLDLTTPNLYDTLSSDNLTYSNAVQFITPFGSLPSNYTQFRKIKIRTTQVTVDRSINEPSPYALVVVGGMAFIESVQIDEIDFQPHWTTIKYVSINTQQINIDYSLLNDEWPSDDELFEINDGDGILNIVFNIQTHQLSGDASGTFDSPNSVFTTQFDDNSISIFVTEEKVGNCSNNVLFEPFCPDEAYTEILLHAYCKNAEENRTNNIKLITAPIILLILLLGLIL